MGFFFCLRNPDSTCVVLPGKIPLNLLVGVATIGEERVKQSGLKEASKVEYLFRQQTSFFPSRIPTTIAARTPLTGVKDIFFSSFFWGEIGRSHNGHPSGKENIPRSREGLFGKQDCGEEEGIKSRRSQHPYFLYIAYLARI